MSRDAAAALGFATFLPNEAGGLDTGYDVISAGL